MQDTMKIGAAAAGGYVLGRTKKAKAAIGLALWLAGRKRPADLARDQAVKALRSDRGQNLIDELRGPVLSAGRHAALTMFESRAERLGDAMQRHTERLGTRGDRDRQDRDDRESPDDEYDDDDGHEDGTDEYDDEEDDDAAEDDEYDDEYDDEEDDDAAEDDVEDEYDESDERERASA